MLIFPHKFRVTGSDWSGGQQWRRKPSGGLRWRWKSSGGCRRRWRPSGGRVGGYRWQLESTWGHRWWQKPSRGDGRSPPEVTAGIHWRLLAKTKAVSKACDPLEAGCEGWDPLEAEPPTGKHSWMLQDQQQRNTGSCRPGSRQGDTGAEALGRHGSEALRRYGSGCWTAVKMMPREAARTSPSVDIRVKERITSST